MAEVPYKLTDIYCFCPFGVRRDSYEFNRGVVLLFLRLSGLFQTTEFYFYANPNAPLIAKFERY